MNQKQQIECSEVDRVQRINNALAEKVMGWRVCSARFYTGRNEYIVKHSFDPMRDLRATVRLIVHARTQDSNLCGKLTFATDEMGSMLFCAGVSCSHGSGRASRPTASQALSEAIATAHGIDLQGGAR